MEIKNFYKIKNDVEKYKFGISKYIKENYDEGDVIFFKHGVYALHGTVKTVLDELNIPYFVWDTCYKKNLL